MKISPARVAAFDVLLKIEKEHTFSSVLLPAAESPLSQQDIGLCHELVLGSIRKQLYLDRVIAVLSNERRIDVEVKVALRLAIYQLRFLDRIPPHSAVNDSVALVHRGGKSSARAFVNALLRRLLREYIEIGFKDDFDRLSTETSHPLWLLKKWSEDFGLEAAQRLAAANNITPPPAFRLIDPDPGLENEVLSLAGRSEFVTGCLVAYKANRRLTELSQSGKIYFQDEASQMVASSICIRQGQRTLDVCASPGGKTSIISHASRNKGSSVFAGDISERRLRLLTETCGRNRADVRGIVQYDAQLALPFEAQAFDQVLVDAPCSGTGTIRHNPELRYFVTLDEICRSSDKQLRILLSASEMVRPGGYLIYSTCSLEREENEEVCDRFVREVVNFTLAIPSLPRRFVTSDGYARTWPDRDDMDGFFVARFRRN